MVLEIFQFCNASERDNIGIIIRPNKNICVFQVSALKKIGMVGQHNILSKYFI